MDEVADDVGAQHEVIHHTGGHYLSGVPLIKHVLAKRLPNPVDRCVIELLSRDHRIDDTFNVVDRDVGYDLDGPRVRIDLDLGYGRSVG